MTISLREWYSVGGSESENEDIEDELVKLVDGKVNYGEREIFSSFDLLKKILTFWRCTRGVR